LARTYLSTTAKLHARKLACWLRWVGGKVKKTTNGFSFLISVWKTRLFSSRMNAHAATVSVSRVGVYASTTVPDPSMQQVNRTKVT